MHDDWPAPRVPPPAQLSATLRMLEAVDDLRRDVDALRVEIRPRRGSLVSGAALRVAAESAILIAVAALAGAGHLRPVLIVALMGAALAAVVLAEWLASRAAYVPRSFGFAPVRPVAVVDPLPERGYGADVEPVSI